MAGGMPMSRAQLHLEIIDRGLWSPDPSESGSYLTGPIMIALCFGCADSGSHHRFAHLDDNCLVGVPVIVMLSYYFFAIVVYD